ERGDRVRGGTAYRGARAEVHEGVERVYLVECDVSTPPGVERVVVDHHREGDPGYGRPPKDFMAASSIGQVIEHLAQMGAITLPLFSQWGVIARLSDYQHCDGFWETDRAGRH